MPFAKQADSIAEHAKEDFDDERNECDRAKNADIGQCQTMVKQIKRVERSKIAQNGTLGKIKRAKHEITQSFVFLAYCLLE